MGKMLVGVQRNTNLGNLHYFILNQSTKSKCMYDQEIKTLRFCIRIDQLMMEHLSHFQKKSTKKWSSLIRKRDGILRTLIVSI